MAIHLMLVGGCASPGSVLCETPDYVRTCSKTPMHRARHCR
jgi:hypothetical protein